MPRRRRAAKGRRGDLTDRQWWDLLLGADPTAWSKAWGVRTQDPGTPSRRKWVDPSIWPDGGEERRLAWFAHREELVYSVNPGTRPAAFWDYEHPEVPFAEQTEGWLAEHGLLSETEQMVIASWPKPYGADSSNDEDDLAADLADDDDW